MRPRPQARRLFETPREAARLLIASDNLYTRRVLRVMLAHPRLQLLEVCDGEQAVDLLALRTFDLVVLDIGMQQMTGPETLSWIRRSMAPWADVPVLGLVGEEDRHHLGRLWTTGLTDYTPKPLNRIDIGSKLLALLPGLYDAGI
jgi:CheY-like chemotaxis protein